MREGVRPATASAWGEATLADRLIELIGSQKLASRVAELSAQLDDLYADRDLLMVGVLKGCFLFLADLARQMKLNPIIDFLRVASYGSATESSGVVEIRKDLETSVFDREVLIVEDIVDTGLTVDYLKRHLQAGKPKSVRVCTLLDKPSRRKVELKPDFIGFEIPDHFVVGYGLDFDEKYRNLPAICILERNGREPS